MDKQKEMVYERPLLIPHQAIVKIDAVINQQMNNGMWSPRAVFHDQFFLRLEGTTEKSVTDDLKNKLEELKKKWTEDGGQIGLIKN